MRIRSLSEVCLRTTAYTIFLFLLFSCGVKTAPVAKVREPVVTAPRLDCDPRDPTCDRTDPAYVPQVR